MGSLLLPASRDPATRSAASVDAEDSVLPVGPVAAETVPVAGAVAVRSVTPLRRLGQGRAAEATLVRFTTEQGETRMGVEKCFRPGWLTRLIYRAAFQSPFAYRDNRDAICASFYRRRVAATLIPALVPGARVAAPLYVRWDRQRRAFVLASEYIPGRGVVPPPSDPRTLRRGLARWAGRRTTAPPAGEIRELLQRMTEIEQVLLEVGLTGSGWQVSKRALVSTANLLRYRDQYVVIDLESGIPSVLVPRYLAAGLALRSFPLFDDLNADKLGRWLAVDGLRLRQQLGEETYAQLRHDSERLARHSARWKASEWALGRRPRRLFTRAFRVRLRSRLLASWRRHGVLDETTHQSLRRTRWFFVRPCVWAGMVPGAIGRGVTRLLGNHQSRHRLRRFLVQSRYRRRLLKRHARLRRCDWERHGRLPPAQAARRFDLRFIAHALLAALVPIWLHRWLADPRQRRNRWMQLFLLLVSRRFQRDFGVLFVDARLQSWARAERLDQAQLARLREQLSSPAIDEYVRCFGIHLGLKLLSPLVWSLRLGGTAAWMASGNPLYFLVTLFFLPMLRSVVTLWRMLAGPQPAGDYRDALLVGLMPMVGSLAFAVQMYAKHPEFSTFLMRDFAAQAGRRLPIYGGPDSRTELWLIKCVDLVAEVIELWLGVTGRWRLGPGAEVHPDRGEAVPSAQPIAPRSHDRWASLADRQIAILRQRDRLTAH